MIGLKPIVLGIPYVFRTIELRLWPSSTVSHLGVETNEWWSHGLLNQNHWCGVPSGHLTWRLGNSQTKWRFIAFYSWENMENQWKTIVTFDYPEGNSLMGTVHGFGQVQSTWCLETKSIFAKSQSITASCVQLSWPKTFITCYNIFITIQKRHKYT